MKIPPYWLIRRYFYMPQELTAIELTEESIESMVYEIRNQKVMLDFDLARIYGYATKRFNEQVKNNIEKFPGDFMFQLTEEESRDLVKCQFGTSRKSVIKSEDLVMSKKSTSRKENYFKGNMGGTRKLPYAFTEQGIYMLMTVLKGELATKQSKDAGNRITTIEETGIDLINHRLIEELVFG